jgi:hypothetical protein
MESHPYPSDDHRAEAGVEVLRTAEKAAGRANRETRLPAESGGWLREMVGLI